MAKVTLKLSINGKNQSTKEYEVDNEQVIKINQFFNRLTSLRKEAATKIRKKHEKSTL